jgi:hypothetical protein
MDDLNNNIIQLLTVKSETKAKVYDATFSVFKELKQITHELANRINSQLPNKDKRISLEYNDKGTFESELRVAGDLLVFSMHTNVFTFNRDHLIWQTSYAKNDKLRSHCGIINIYNFLADSFRYNRNDDLGYLIARIYVNHEKAFWVEGKRQLGYVYNDFGNKVLDANCLTDIVETAIQYSLDFDLLVPPFDEVKIASVGQLNQKIDSARIVTGKRLGFRYNSDDVGSL